MSYLLVALGSAVGGVARYGIGLLVTARWGNAFPWGTLLINALGSFVIGYASGWAANPAVRLLVMVGLCGGFTTFSSFSLETLSLLRLGEWQKALAYVAASMILCLVMVAAGVGLARWQR